MQDINKLKNYREKYKRYYQLNFSSEYQIHHIDFNHNNNDISNLLLLPKDLHQKFHRYMNALTPYVGEDKRTISFNINDKNFLYVFSSDLEELIGTALEVDNWVEFKRECDIVVENRKECYQWQNLG